MPSYTQNGILHMLDRNKRIKPRPERFQNCRDLFDLILTCEERVYDQVVEGEPRPRACTGHSSLILPLSPVPGAHGRPGGPGKGLGLSCSGQSLLNASPRTGEG